MPNAKDIIYSQDVLYIIKTNQSEYALEGMKSCYLASGNIIMVDVTNKLLDVRNGDSYGSKYEDSAILRQVYRYTGAQVSRGGGGGVWLKIFVFCPKKVEEKIFS